MLGILYSFFFVGVGCYIIKQGWKMLKTKKVLLGPSERLGIWGLRYFKGSMEADMKEEELKNKNPEKLGWSNILFGIPVLLIGVLGLIIQGCQ